jgi:hypothetical protein
MAVFPPYQPNERAYDLGAHPVVTQEGWAGGAMRFRTGGIRVGILLRLTFRRLVAAAATQIADHYATQFSSGEPFQLTDATLSDSRYWVYEDTPAETHLSGGLVDMTVTLRSVR